MSRKTDRKHAFNLIFQMDFFKEGLEPEELLKNYFDSEPFLSDDTGLTSEADRDYVGRTFLGLALQRDAIDKEISARARGWQLERFMKTDLAILRLAVYELLHEPDVPEKVAINEAVELSKEYSGGDSPAFINGLLGQVVRNKV